MNRKLATILAASSIALIPACAQESVNTADKAAVEEIVRAYILENPEIIEEALISLQTRQEVASAEEAQAAIKANFDKLYNNPDDYFIGPADAEVTVVEFFDYRCGYCKRSQEWTMDLVEKYPGKVKVVFKELPILSAESEKAAHAAIAAGKQGKYVEMHEALMALDNNTGFKPADIDRVAESVGVDVAKMRADMDSVKVRKIVSDSSALARELGIGGTPNYLVGLESVPGADQAAVERLIEVALKG